MKSVGGIMQYAVDLHIHSVLSPCSDDGMTPNNIINMAILKRLDFIAVTDHNSTGNLKAVLDCALGRDLIVVPGIEVETAEEVHLVCLFPSLHTAIEAGDIISSALPEIKNREEIFGRQLLMDEYDNIKAEVGQLLLTATRLPLEEVFRITVNAGGVVIPAHINRSSYSILSNLGAIPGDLNIKYVEITPRDPYEAPNGYIPIISSDAHSLGDILERTSLLDLPQKSIECLIQKLKGRVSPIE